MTGEIFLIVNIVLLIFSVYMIFRNGCVYRARRRIGQKIHDYNIKCIDDGSDRTKFVDYSDAEIIYSYNTMMFKFWKPVKIMEAEILMDLELQ